MSNSIAYSCQCLFPPSPKTQKPTSSSSSIDIRLHHRANQRISKRHRRKSPALSPSHQMLTSKLQLLRSEIERRRQEFFSLQNEAATIEQEISYLVDLSIFGTLASTSASATTTTSSTNNNNFSNEAESSELESDEAENDFTLQKASVPRLQALIQQGHQQQLAMAAMSSHHHHHHPQSSQQQQSIQAKAPSFVNRPAVVGGAAGQMMIPANLIGHPMLGGSHTPAFGFIPYGCSSSSSIINHKQSLGMAADSSQQQQQLQRFPTNPNHRSLSHVEINATSSRQHQRTLPISSQSSSNNNSMMMINDGQSSYSKPKRVRALPINESGNLLLPVVLGRANSRVSIYSIGEIVPAFCNSKFIYPVGFLSKRKFPSAIALNKRIIYTCRILNGLFQITPQQQLIAGNEALKAKIEANSMEQLWELFKARFAAHPVFPELQMIRSGEEFFGLDHEGVKKYIQEMPLAKHCTGYQFVNFITRAPTVRKASPISSSSSSHSTTTNAAISNERLSLGEEEDAQEQNIQNPINVDDDEIIEDEEHVDSFAAIDSGEGEEQ